MSEQILFDTYTDLLKIEEVSQKLLPYLFKYKYVILKGKLGAGKTTFVQNILKILGSSDAVHSPTFSIINTYQAKNTNAESTINIISILHSDLYRVESIDELEMTGFFDQLVEADIAFIEWGDKLNIIDEFERHIELAIEYLPNRAEGGRRYIAKAFKSHKLN